MTLAAPPRPANRPSLERWLPLGVALIIYMVAAITFKVQQPDRLSPDGVSYLRLAGYLATGDWHHGLSSYWSPLLPGLVALAIRLGMDALDAGHLVVIGAGAGILVAMNSFLSTWFKSRPAVRGIALAALAGPIAQYEAFVLSPDLLLSLCLLAYFCALGRWAHGPSTARAFFVGVVAGVSILAKAYALPFLLVHLPASLWILRPRHSPFWAPLGTAGIAFAIAVVLWGFALRETTGSFTLGVAGPINHAVVGPPDRDREHPIVFAPPEPPHVTIWETPERLPYQFWSPLQSRAYFEHQVSVAAGNARSIAVMLFRLDTAGFLILALVGAPFIFRRSGADPVPRVAWWLIGTVALYLGGYLWVAFEPRYANSLILPLAVAMAAEMISRLPSKWLRIAAGSLALSFAFRWAPDLTNSLSRRSTPYMEEIAQALRETGMTGRFASTSWPHGVALAFFSERACVGFPPDPGSQEISRKLREAVTDWVVVFDLPSLPAMPVHDLFPPAVPRAMALVTEDHWVRRGAYRFPMGRGDAVILFFQRPAAPAGTAP